MKAKFINATLVDIELREGDGLQDLIEWAFQQKVTPLSTILLSPQRWIVVLPPEHAEMVRKKIEGGLPNV